MKPFLSEKAWNRVIIFFVLLFVAYLSVPARASAPEQLIIVQHYPVEYCISITALSSTLLAKNGDSTLAAAHKDSLNWFITTTDLEENVIDLVMLKLKSLLNSGEFNEEDIVEAGAECRRGHLAYLAQE